MITHVFLFTNGNVACTDEKGEQVPEWQSSLLVEHLLKMREAGAINDDTLIETASGRYVVGEFLPPRP